jgi:hypothetical protein
MMHTRRACPTVSASSAAGAHSDGEVVMESDHTADTAGVPEPTNALFLPTTAVPNESSNLAWSTDDHPVGRNRSSLHGASTGLAGWARSCWLSLLSSQRFGC